MVIIVLIVFGLLIAFLLLPSVQSHGYSNRVHSASNLRQIGQAIRLYSNDTHGQYPDTLFTLLQTEDITPQVFISPSDSINTEAQGATTQAMEDQFSTGLHCSYVYLGRGFDTHMNLPADVVVCYEPRSVNSGRGMYVLFADGHVDWMDAKAGAAIMEEAAIGVSPVRWPVPASTMPGK